MSKITGPRACVILAVVLLCSSVGILLYNVFVTLSLPTQEARAREQIAKAGQQLANAAGQFDVSRIKGDREAAHEQLRHLADQVLAGFPGVEGGFYIAEGAGGYAGYSFPTTTHVLPKEFPRNEPPPLEAGLIQVLIERSLDQGESVMRTEDVGPSRVVVFVQPVGERWPARLAVWLLDRLTGPEQLAAQVRLYTVSISLALGGITVSLFLTGLLVRHLSQQRREQEKLRDELRRSEHLAGLGKLLAGVAHEVRNPLAGLSSTVQLWQRLPDATRTPESLAAVVAAVNRISSLVGRLLLFARTDNSSREQVDLNQVVSETYTLLQAKAAEQDVRLECDLDSRAPTVFGSANALRQVLLNLLMNALQATTTGGRVLCRTRLEGSHAVTTVEDSGPGVSPEAKAHLFEPFYTTRADGTGLGLALCREILQSHDGHIELVLGSHQGAVFRFDLPVTTSR